MTMNRKILKIISIAILLCNCVNVNAAIADNVCSEITSTLKLGGYLLLILKCAAPLLIVIMGTMDFYKAVMDGKTDTLKKEAIILGKRLLIGIFIFFIPTIINFVVDNVGGGENSDYKTCVSCLTNPLSGC